MLEYSFGLDEEAAAVNAPWNGAQQRPRDGGFETRRQAGHHGRSQEKQFVRQSMKPSERSSKRSGTATSSHEEPGRAQRCSTSICTWCTKSLRRRRSRAARARPQSAPSRSDHRDHGPQHAHHATALPIVDPIAAKQVAQLEKNCKRFRHPVLRRAASHQGIVHVIGPELGLTQPGMTVVCGDSHTATHGAFGALAFGIGTSEVEHVLATQCLLQRPSKTFRVRWTAR
jgi:hypothetical protein